jgi:glycosyltransferase involved in cell wall biosynthesis
MNDGLTRSRIAGPGRRLARRVTRPMRVLARLARRDPSAWSQIQALLARMLPVFSPAAAAQPVLKSTTDLATPRVTFVSGEPSTPGHLYRVVRYADAARAAGAAVTVLRMDEIPTRLAEVGAANIVVIWRGVWDSRVSLLVRTARQVGARIVFDVDDLLVDPTLARVAIMDGIRSQSLAEDAVRDFHARMRRTMLCADFCTTTTHELARHIRKTSRPTLVLPNGFDDQTFKASRISARRWAANRHDDLRRIGYACGSRTHQRDFALCAGAVARLLREQPDCRLVLFRSASGETPLLDITEFPELAGLEGQIEWRILVPLALLPNEIARFDVNLAPLEIGNPFCEAKSELKFFEAALAGVCTVASPTGPFRRAIRDGETGLLADGVEAWCASLSLLLDDPDTRRRVAAAALRDVLWAFGPTRRVELMASTLDQLRGGRFAARAFALELERDATPVSAAPTVTPTETVFESDKLRPSDVTVGIPLHNCAHFVIEALDSVRSQTLQNLDLIVVDDASTDDSLAVAVEWAKRSAMRFNRLLVLRNLSNAGLGPTRNVCFETADTPYVLPLAATNRLLPPCAEVCLEKIRAAGAAYAYPLVRILDTDKGLLGDVPFDPARFVGGNYIDAMALVAKGAWAAVGGYDGGRSGWEDFDLWCRFVERGLVGQQVGGVPLGELRAYGASTRPATTDLDVNRDRPAEDMQRRHPWLSITDTAISRKPLTDA